MRADVLVTAEELAAALADDEPPVLLDVRWALGRTREEAHERYLAGHVPAAAYVDLEAELAAPPSPLAGRHPLPPVAELEAAARRWGVREGASVVVYDDVADTSAARAWWLLRWAGVGSVRLLDGGLAAWTAAGLSLEAGEVTAEPGDLVVRPGGMPTLDADEAAAWPASGTLLDARAAERYAGLVEPVDPRAGHVPGAVSAPTWGNLAGDGRFLPDGALRARFAGLAGPVAVYCGSGVTAAHEVAALAAIGVDAALFPGSWSAWSNDPARPVATGDRP
jgi:thiosulfate/3-mercaptopyruvate sulfurtransferase